MRLEGLNCALRRVLWPALLGVALLAPVPAHALGRILVLHSAHHGFVVTDAAMRGIQQAFFAEELPPQYWVEYLDRYRFRGLRHDRVNADRLALKYGDFSFDAVLATGNHAFEFALAHRERLFPGVPIVFSGVTGKQLSALRALPGVTGVMESGGFRDTLDAAFALNPRSNEIVFITGGLLKRELVEHLVPDYRPEITMTFISDEYLSEVRRALTSLSPTAVVVPLAAPAIAPGEPPLPLDWFVERIARSTPAPMYAVWDYLLGHGVVGGLLVSGAAQARQAAKMALDLARGRPLHDIDVLVERPTHFTFDFEAMQRFGLDPARAPADSVIINRPLGLFEQYRGPVLATAAVLAVLLAFSLALSLAVIRRRRAERSLRESEEKYRQVFATESDAILLFDADQPTIIDANDAAARLYDYSLSQLLTLRPLDLSAEQDKSRAFVREVRDTRFGTVSQRKHRRRDGTVFPVDISMSAFTLKGREVICAVIRDITERMKIDEELRRSEKRFQDFAASASDWYWEMDEELRFTYLSERFSEVTGIPAARLLGSRLSDADGKGVDPAAWRSHLADLEARRPFRHFIQSQLQADGMRTYLTVNGRPVFDAEGVFRGYRGTGSDITEAKRREDELNSYRYHLEELVDTRTAALEAANRELHSFSYSVSHDLRSPLRAIDGFSHVLMEDYGEVLDERAHSYLGRVRAASQRMGQLIDGLLELSRLTRRTMRLDNVDLSGLCEQVVETLRERDATREVEFAIEPSLHCFGDQRLLRVVVENLLDNAWKYTAERARARIEFGSQVDSKGVRVYFVRDNGVGFDMRYVHKLFGEFQRLHHDTEYAGTGIGLATVARIVRRHGGKVWAEGALGQGATFSFTLGEAELAEQPSHSTAG